MVNPVMAAYNRLMRKRTAKACLMAIAVALINLNGFVRLGICDDIAFALLVTLAVFLDCLDIFHALLLCLLLRTSSWWLPGWVFDLPAIGFLVPFLVSLLVVLIIPRARLSLGWIHAGRIERVSWFLILIGSSLSTVALLLWAFWTDNLGVGEHMMASVAHLPPMLVLGVGIPIFALINALAEEVTYRGVFQQGLGYAFEHPAIVILLQATAFAAAHVRGGFPNGLAGYVMVVVYGSLLGYLRHRSKGLLAPYLTHVLGDLTIGYFLYFRVAAAH